MVELGRRRRFMGGGGGQLCLFSWIYNCVRHKKHDDVCVCVCVMPKCAFLSDPAKASLVFIKVAASYLFGGMIKWT